MMKKTVKMTHRHIYFFMEKKCKKPVALTRQSQNMKEIRPNIAYVVTHICGSMPMEPKKITK